MLSSVDLRRVLANSQLVVDDMVGSAVQPASIDLHLDEHFLVWDKSRISADPFESDPGTVVSTDGVPVLMPDRQQDWTVPFKGALLLPPGEMVLASTVERVALDTSLAARVEGKSSLGRLGLLIHMAGFIDPGFSGTITLELVNMTRYHFLLTPGMKIAQLSVFELDSPTDAPYSSAIGSSYSCQEGPTASALWSKWKLHPKFGGFDVPVV